LNIIDVHVHCGQGKDFLERLVEVCGNTGIKKVCLNGLAPSLEKGFFWNERNDLVEKAMKEYPDLILGMAWLRLDEDSPNMVDNLYTRGFSGLKLIFPRFNWDYEGYYSFYARAEANRMPILFHTGIVYPAPERHFGISSARMDPMYLDTIAWAFPDLPIIGAHLGDPYYDVACGLAHRYHPNLYWDVSGGNTQRNIVQRKLIGGRGDEIAWGERVSPRRLVYGSDCGVDEIARDVEEWKKSLDGLGIGNEDKEHIFHRNAAKIFGVKR